MRTPLAPLAFSALALVAAEPARPLMIQHVRIFDGSKVLAADSVLVQDGKILKIGQGLKAPAGADTRDGAGCTLLPGLIDAHVHAYGDALRQSLALGVTTVIDMFTEPSLPRAAKANPDPACADIRSAGILATCPKGHGTEYPVAVATLERPEEAEAWVEARLKEGSDFIKIVYDDAHLFGFNLPTLKLATVKALIEATHRHGKLAVVHVATGEAAREALEAGADGLVHAWLDKADGAALGKLAKARNAFVIPTLSAFTPGHAVGLGARLAGDAFLAPYLSAEAVGSLRTRAGDAPGFPGRAATAALRAAGVPLLAGTDAPNPGTTYGASLHGELELLVQAGLTNLEALQAATRIPAFAFGLRDRGAVAPGLRADLLLVKGDPTQDIQATRAIVAIWKAGVPVDRAAFSRELEARRAQVKQAPGFSAGLVSSFQETLAAREGGAWNPSTDAMAGGASTVKVSSADGAMRLEGIVDGKLPFAWAGALWTPGGGFDKPRNFSGLKELRFRAQAGAEGRFRVMLFTATGGFMPRDVFFAAGPQWQDVVIPLERFEGADLATVTALVIGAGPKAGAFTLSVNDLRFQ